MSVGALRAKFNNLRVGQVVFAVVAVLLSIAILGYLIYRERDVLLEFDWQLRWEYLIAGFFLYSFMVIAAGCVWADSMRVLGSKISLRTHLHHYCLSHVAKRIPGTVWYVAGRVYLYKQDGELARRVTIATGLEFVLIFVAGVLLTVGAVSSSLLEISQQNLVVLLLCAVLGLAAIHPRSINWMLRRVNLTVLPNWKFTDILRWLLGYTFMYFCGGLLLFWIANAVLPLGIEHLLFVVGIWGFVGTISSAVFFLPSNLGINEVGISLLLSTIILSSFAVIIAVMVRFVQMTYELILLGLVLLFLRNRSGEDAQRDSHV